MSNITTLPMEDAYETRLSQSYDGALGTMNLVKAPTFTLPAGETTYLIVNPGTASAQLAEIDSINVGLNTVNVSNITALELGAGISSVQLTHATNSKVLISDNYQFWRDIVDAVNSKLDNDGGNTTTTFDLAVSGSAFRIRKDSLDMKFTDGNNAEVSLSTLAAGAGTDTKVGVTISDTTPSQLDSKLTAGDGLSKTIINPAANEVLDLDIDLADTTIFSTAGVASRAAVTDGSGNLFQATETARGGVERATDAEVVIGIDTTRYITSKQGADNYITTYDVVLATRTLNAASTTITHAHNLGKIPRLITVSAVYQTGTSHADSYGTWEVSGDVNNCIFRELAGAGGLINTTRAITIQETDDDGQRGVIGNVTTTDFDVVWTFTPTPSSSNNIGLIFTLYS